MKATCSDRFRGLPGGAPPWHVTAALLAAGLLAGGCSGQPDGTMGPKGPGHDDGEPRMDDGDDPLDADLPALVPGPVTVRRLTNQQYANTVRSVLGVSGVELSEHLTSDRGLGLFANGDHQADASTGLVQSYGAAAHALAKAAAERRGELFDDQSCGELADCLNQFVQEFAWRLFRRRGTDDEIEAVVGAAREAAGPNEEFWSAAEAALEIMLQSAPFLYVVETGARDDSHPDWWRRDDHTLATRLALMLWNEGPDAELLSLADEGRLKDRTELRAQVDRLLNDDRFIGASRQFFREWLGYDLSLNASKSDLYPEYRPELVTSMVGETDRLIEHFMSGDLPVLGIFDTDYTFADPQMRAFYGDLTPGEEGSDRYSLPETRRGILGHASFIAANSGPDLPSPTTRGLGILERFLCGSVAAPPADAPADLPEDPSLGPQTIRERTETFMLGNKDCRPCHMHMDGIGFLLENFDSIGRYRETEPVEGAPGGVKPVNALSDIPLWDMQDVAGLPGLARALATHPEGARCLLRHLFEWSMARKHNDDDARAVAEMEATMEREGGSLRAAMRGLASGQSVVYFRPEEAQQ